MEAVLGLNQILIFGYAILVFIVAGIFIVSGIVISLGLLAIGILKDIRGYGY